MRDLVKGNTLEEKMTSVERVLGHMRNRMHKTVTVAIPPIPFSLFSQSVVAGNVLGAFMFPISCDLSDMIVMIEGTSFRKGVLTVSIYTGTEKHDHAYLIAPGKTSITFKESVKAGDRIIFRVTEAEYAKAKEGQEAITVIEAMWISFLCITDMKSMNREEHLLDTVLKSADMEVDK